MIVDELPFNANNKARIDRWQDADELKWAVHSWAARVGVKDSSHYRAKSWKSLQELHVCLSPRLAGEGTAAAQS
jgi:hypothetical protein